jgi:hypothetical protein
LSKTPKNVKALLQPKLPSFIFSVSGQMSAKFFFHELTHNF